jgi:hypothetical protein
VFFSLWHSINGRRNPLLSVTRQWNLCELTVDDNSGHKCLALSMLIWSAIVAVQAQYYHSHDLVFHKYNGSCQAGTQEDHNWEKLLLAETAINKFTVDEKARKLRKNILTKIHTGTVCIPVCSTPLMLSKSASRKNILCPVNNLFVCKLLAEGHKLDMVPPKCPSRQEEAANAPENLHHKRCHVGGPGLGSGWGHPPTLSCINQLL